MLGTDVPEDLHSDRELIDAWARGDKRAGDAFVERHFDASADSPASSAPAAAPSMP